MHLAQLNIAKAKAPLEDPLMQEFMDNLDPINAIADASGDATGINAFDDLQLIINMSVWESVEALKDFMFKTHHVNFLKRKQEWFEKLSVANHVLWWVALGYEPTLEEAKERLMHLREHGESAYAFSFRSKFEANDL